MKSKTPLALMEQLVMVVVFALAAALCVSCFVAADRLSRRSALRDEAVSAAQTAAETVKGCRGDLEQAAARLDGQWNGETVAVHNDSYTLVVETEDTGDPLLGRARISVYAVENDGLLFELAVFWQEVTGHG